jgi:hypothetical protein
MENFQDMPSRVECEIAPLCAYPTLSERLRFRRTFAIVGEG